MDQFKKTYERFYDEPLNAELYRDMYGMKTNKDMKKIQVESMLFEAHIRSNNNNNGLIYKLRRPLDSEFFNCLKICGINISVEKFKEFKNGSFLFGKVA